MAQNSKIEWTDDTDNPIRVKGGGHYCFKVSTGCSRCYAERLNMNSFFGGNKMPYVNQKSYPEMELRRDILAGWARKKKPRKHFVSSVTDVFGEFVPDAFIFEMLDAMCAAPLQTFQVLTKRASRMREKVDEFCIIKHIDALPSHIWMLVSVEDQEQADKRIPELLKARVSVRGLSVEPMLEKIDLRRYLFLPEVHGQGPADIVPSLAINWVICGGESGTEARPMHPDWPADLQKQCELAGVAFFFKQWGEWLPFKESADAPLWYSCDEMKYHDGHFMKMLDVNSEAGRFNGYKWMNPFDAMDASNWKEGEMMVAFLKTGKRNNSGRLFGIEYHEFPTINNEGGAR